MLYMAVSVLLRFINAEHADTLLEATRVLGNLTRERDVRDFVVRHRSMHLPDDTFLIVHQSINQSIAGICIAPPTKHGRRRLTM